MSQPHGMLALEDLTRLVASGEIDTVIVAFTDVYGRLVGKRFDAGTIGFRLGGGVILNRCCENGVRGRFRS